MLNTWGATGTAARWALECVRGKMHELSVVARCTPMPRKHAAHAGPTRVWKPEMNPVPSHRAFTSTQVTGLQWLFASSLECVREATE